VADNKLRRQDPEGHKRALAERKQKKLSAKEAFAASISEKVCTKCEATKPMGDFREHRGLYGRSSWCLECERQYSRDWTSEHHEEYNSKRREIWANTEFTIEQRGNAARRARGWYAENKDQATATRKLYYAEHSEEIKAYVKEWQKANPEKCREYYKRWHVDNAQGRNQTYYSEHSEEVKQRAHIWAIHNPEKRHEHKRRWYINNAASRKATGLIRAAVYAQGNFDFDQWFSTLEVFCHACAYCLCTDRPLTMDHVLAISKGGLHTAGNIVPACRSCNSKKGKRSVFSMLNQPSVV
jgi:5-methylcytosine-specific restriction endonuclease McrA